MRSFWFAGPERFRQGYNNYIVSGHSRPTSGQVTVLGHDIFKNIIAVYAALGAVPQETALCEELSAWTKMSLHADLYGVRGPKSDGRIAENAKSSPTLRTSREWSEYILGRYEVPPSSCTSITT
jgi:hypothetical protein